MILCDDFPWGFFGGVLGGGRAVWADKAWETKIACFSAAGLVGGRAVWVG